MTLINRLRRLAQIWADAHGKELSTLGTMVAKDGKFFNRLEQGKTCTVAVVERFLDFFRDAASWPALAIPAAAAELLEELKDIGTAGSPEMQISALGLMAAPAAAAEADPSPFANGKAPAADPAPSSQTCSATIAPTPLCAASAAPSIRRSSSGREADAA